MEDYRPSIKRYRKLQAHRHSDNFATSIAIVEAEVEPLKGNEILVRNHFAGINGGFDTLLCRGDIPYVDTTLPFDLGVEAVGTVINVAEGVDGITIGDAIATTARGGGYREYQIIDAESAISIQQPIPEILTLLPTGLSALVGLEYVGEMHSGETILITAAAGGIGHIALQLAKLANNHVIGTCGSPEKVALLERLGCDRAINYRQEDVHHVLQSEYPNGINLIFDCVGGSMFDIGVSHLATRGRLVAVGFISEYGQPPQLIMQPRIYHQLFWKSASVRGFLLPRYPEAIPKARDHLLNLFYQNKLQVQVDPTEFWELESIPAAVSHLLSGQNCGKVVVRFATPYKI